MSLIVGANPGLAETAGGTLYNYFVDFYASERYVYLPLVLRNH